MRKEYPWKCIAAPILKSNEQGQFEVGPHKRDFILEKQIPCKIV